MSAENGAGIKFDLSDTQMRQALSVALLASLDGEARDRIIAQAIEYLTNPEKDSYGRAQRSPMQVAFENALRNFAADWAKEFVENEPTIREAFEQTVRDIASKALTDKTDLVEQAVSAMGRVSISVREDKF